jgi:hypothetical protein
MTESAEVNVVSSWLDGNFVEVDLQTNNWPTHQLHALREELIDLAVYLHQLEKGRS